MAPGIFYLAPTEDFMMKFVRLPVRTICGMTWLNLRLKLIFSCLIHHFCTSFHGRQIGSIWFCGHKAKVVMTWRLAPLGGLMIFTVVTIYLKPEPSSLQFLHCLMIRGPFSNQRNNTPVWLYNQEKKSLDKWNVSGYSLVTRWVSLRIDNFLFVCLFAQKAKNRVQEYVRGFCFFVFFCNLGELTFFKKKSGSIWGIHAERPPPHIHNTHISQWGSLGSQQEVTRH